MYRDNIKREREREIEAERAKERDDCNNDIQENMFL
jgi:hypothetical protein